jgi:hypothetical protein
VGAGHDDRVRGRDGDIDGVIALQRVHAILDHTLGEQRPDGIVEQDVAVLTLGQALAEGRNGTLGGLVARRAALDDLGDLGQPGLGDDLLDVRHIARRHQHNDVIDAVGLLEDRQCVLDHSLACDLQQLLGDGQTHALTGSTGEHDCCGSGFGYVLHRHRRPTLRGLGGAKLMVTLCVTVPQGGRRPPHGTEKPSVHPLIRGITRGWGCVRGD